MKMKSYEELKPGDVVVEGMWDGAVAKMQYLGEGLFKHLVPFSTVTNGEIITIEAGHVESSDYDPWDELVVLEGGE